MPDELDGVLAGLKALERSLLEHAEITRQIGMALIRMKVKETENPADGVVDCLVKLEDIEKGVQEGGPW